MNTIKLGTKIIDHNSLYIIADIGANHNGSLEKALELIHLAKEAGADAAKFLGKSLTQSLSFDLSYIKKGNISKFIDRAKRSNDQTLDCTFYQKF